MKNIENIKKLVIVVDMINGFVKEGIMSDKTIGHIVPAQIELAKKTIKENSSQLIFIRDSHPKYAIEFKTFPNHCEEKSYESEIIDELKPFEKDSIVYKKNSTSAMFADDFINDIEKMKELKEVIITGCCTDICVTNLAIPLKNYFNQKNKDVEIEVPMNMVETYNSDSHNRFIYNK